MLQYLSHWTTRKLFAKNTFKFALNINFGSKLVHSKFQQIDLLQINKKNMKYITLSDTERHKMPVIGIGTWKALKDDVYNAIKIALDVGYRHIDTAFNYNNEEQIGAAINDWIQSEKGTRENLFITTKLPVFANRSRDVEKFLKLSLSRLKLDYVDLYLIHMPFSFQLNDEGVGPMLKEDGSPELDLDNDNIATWKAMEEQVRRGRVKSIGLSNFSAQQVEKIYNSADIKPSVLQVEMHAHLQQHDLLEVCKRLNIAVTAYAPLGSPGAVSHFSSKYKYEVKTPPNALVNPVVQDIAKKYNKTTGQILLKYLVEKNVIVIPKSANPKRIEENFMIFDFDLEDADRMKLNALDKKDEGRIFTFLFFKDVEKHPEYPFKHLLSDNRV